MPTGYYPAYEGGQTATLMDTDRHTVGTLPVKGVLKLAAESPSLIKLNASGEGAPPWVRFEAKTLGARFSVDNPYKTVRYQKLMDTITSQKITPRSDLQSSNSLQTPASR